MPERNSYKSALTTEYAHLIRILLQIIYQNFPMETHETIARRAGTTVQTVRDWGKNGRADVDCIFYLAISFCNGREWETIITNQELRNFIEKRLLEYKLQAENMKFSEFKEEHIKEGSLIQWDDMFNFIWNYILAMPIEEGKIETDEGLLKKVNAAFIEYRRLKLLPYRNLELEKNRKKNRPKAKNMRIRFENGEEIFIPAHYVSIDYKDRTITWKV